MVGWQRFNGKVRRIGLLVIVALALVLTALPTAAVAAPVSSDDWYGHGSGHHCADCYVVRPGDTLSEIAQWFGVDYWTLARYNGIHDPSRIYAGQKLRIPSGHCGGCGYEKPSHHHGCGGCEYEKPSHHHGCGGCGYEKPSHNPGGCFSCGYYGKPSHGHGCGGCGQHGGYSYHVVRPGDTLSQIARWYGVNIYHLAHKNGITDLNQIYVGQVIYL
jgi:lysozyme